MLERLDVVTEEAVDDLVVVGLMKSRAPAISAKHGGCMIDHLIVLSSVNKNICHSAHLDVPAGALSAQPPYISTCVFSPTPS
ncbi:hypothetical protein KCV07_g294, partial [Aureobasidium melanogenum]